VDLRARRAAENEDLFRRVNERVAELGGSLETLTLVCECADTSCSERLTGITQQEYEHVREHGDRFFVARGHGRPDLETVVDEHDGYAVVEKQGEAGAAARETDPRDG